MSFLFLKMTEEAIQSHPEEMTDFLQRMQITTYFPITWRNTYNQGTGGIDINASEEHIQFIFGDDTYLIEYSEESTIQEVFQKMYALPPLNGATYRFELDEGWDSLPELFVNAHLCQGSLKLIV